MNNLKKVSKTLIGSAGEVLCGKKVKIIYGVSKRMDFCCLRKKINEVPFRRTFSGCPPHKRGISIGFH